MANPTYTKEEIEDMRAAVQAFDEAENARIAAERKAFLKPVRDIVCLQSYNTVMTKLVDLGETYADEINLKPHIEALRTIMKVLKDNVEAG
jgi:translation elongation factor EF-Tu-like GTPase